MTNEEAKTFLDNLKVCIEEHPIVADWLVEIADRKSEPQTDCEMPYKDCEDCETHLKAQAQNRKTEPQIYCRRCKHYATDKCKECFGHELFTDSGYATDCSWQKGE